MTTRRPSQMDVARAIRHVLAATGAHPTRVARHAGLAVSYFGALTRGDRVPSLPTLEDLADALGVPLFVLAFYGVGLNPSAPSASSSPPPRRRRAPRSATSGDRPSQIDL